MRLAIQTKYTKMSFEMTAENANELITEAVSYAQAYRRGQDRVTLDDELEKIETVNPVVEIEKPKPVELKPFPHKPAVQAKEDDYYRGFLHIRCENCGKDKSYNARIPTKHHHCDCGHWTELEGLRPVHINCKCGGSFKYLTNIKDDGFTMNCLNCGDKLDLVLNRMETAYVSFGRMGYAR